MAKSCADIRCAVRVLSVTVALLVAMIITVLVFMITGTGTSAEVSGKVISFGIDFATSSELPRAIVTVELGSGNIINIEGARGVLIGVGDEVVLLRSGGLLASDVDYRFLRVSE